MPKLPLYSFHFGTVFNLESSGQKKLMLNESFEI